MLLAAAPALNRRVATVLPAVRVLGDALPIEPVVPTNARINIAIPNVLILMFSPFG